MIFLGKVYDKLKEWKKTAAGTAAVLLEGACVKIGLNQENPYK